MKQLLLLLFLLFSFGSSQAQLSTLDSARWYHNHADSLHFYANKFKASINYYDYAIRLYSKLPDNDLLLATCYFNRGAVLFNLGQDHAAYRLLCKSAILIKSYNPSTLFTGIYNGIARYHTYRQDYDSAFHYLNLSIAAIKDPRFTISVASFNEIHRAYQNRLCFYKAMPYAQMAGIEMKRGRLEQAAIHIKQAERLNECDESWMAAIKAVFFTQRGEFGKALSLWNQDYQRTKRDNLILEQRNTLNNIANIYMQLGLPHQAIEHYKLVIEQDQASGSNKIASAYNQIGELYRQMGAYDKALSYYRQAYTLIKEQKGDISFSTGSVSNNIGETYYALGAYQEALTWHLQALNIRKELPKHPYLTNSYDNLGMTYLQLGELKKAERYILKAFELREVYPTNAQYSPYHIKSQLHLAALALAKSDDEQALECYKMAIRYNTANLKQEQLANYYVWNKIGALHLKNHRWQEALIAFDKSISQNAPSFDATTSLTAYHSASEILTALVGKGDAYVQLYHHSAEQKQLEEALLSYQMASQVLIKMRQSFSSQTDKIYANQQSDVYDKGIKVAHLLYQKTSNQKYLESLFQFSEQSKAGVLLDAQNNQSAKQQGVLPDSLLQKEQELAALLSHYQQKTQEAQPSERAKWQQLLFETKYKQENFIQQLEKQFPEYHRIKYQSHLPSIKEIQQQLDKDEQFLEFYESDSLLYGFLITPTNVSFNILTKLSSEVLTEFNQHIRNPIQQASNDYFSQQAHQLYQQLVAPFHITKGKLILVPDGRLWHINFDLLLTALPKDRDYRTFPYLFKQTALRYTYSAAYLLNRTHVEKEHSGMLAFAPSYGSLNQDGEKLNSLGQFRGAVGPLLYNKVEIARINESIAGKVLSDEAAVEAVFKEEIKGYSIVHLAMHALIDNNDPLKSRLVFTHNKDSLEDNFLHVYELYNMNIPADLAVLSACNTGIGKLESGEGFMSLGRAFAYAGCPAVVMSQWKVDDLATSQLMELFYQNLAEGKSKSESLRAAKLSYLEQAAPTEAMPYLWGSFIVMGDDSPIEVKQGLNKWWYVGVGILILIGITLLVRSNKI